MLHDVFAVGCCSLDVLVELLNVGLELLDPRRLGGIGLGSRVAGRTRCELRLELAHALGERVARLLADAELAGGLVEPLGEIRDAHLVRVRNLCRWIGSRRRRRGVNGGRVERNHAKPGRVLTVGLLGRMAIVRRRDHGPNRRVRETGIAHCAQAGADAVLGLQQASVLLRKRVCDRTGGREAELHEDLSERLPGPILLSKCLRQLV